jgi:diguanylate cyclase (GGDEF)-like protein/PAS domain S-box-containing protein
MKQSVMADFPPSIALFDAMGRLVDWSPGFATEFADAGALLVSGVTGDAIRNACLLPQRALDLTWAAAGIAPAPFHYINGRLTLTVIQQCSAGGAILRLAQASSQAASLHPGWSDPAGDMLRPSILQMSPSNPVRRNLEEEALRAAHAAAEEANRKLGSILAFTSMVLQSSPLPIGVYAADGQCVEANEAYAELVGKTREQLLEQNFHQIISWRTSGLLETCLIAIRSNSMQHREIHVVSSAGTYVFAECRVLPTQINNTKHLLIQFTDLTKRKRLEDELREYAFHDVLTRLPNRRLLLDKVTQAMHMSKRQNSYFAVLFLDVNKFKELNDAHGHDAGDQLLIQVANRLRNEVRETDTVARLGGDEFVVLLERLGDDASGATEHANAVSDKINQVLSAEYVLGDIRHQGSVSIGIKVFDGDDADLDQILKEADAAMYEAKKGAASKKVSPNDFGGKD